MLGERRRLSATWFENTVALTLRRSPKSQATSLQQDSVARILEVRVFRERVANAEARHHDEAQAVRERPSLIGVLEEELA